MIAPANSIPPFTFEYRKEDVENQKTLLNVLDNQKLVLMGYYSLLQSIDPEFIDEIHSRGMTTFLVTNGTNPDMLRKILEHQPTQLYITLPAPDEETYLKVCRPLIKDGWKKIMESLELLKEFSCRKTIRLTLVKDENMINPEGYAGLIKNIDADFFEFKAYVYVGYSQYRLSIENMPRHHEIMDFASRVAELAGMKVIDEKKESRVALAARKDRSDRIMEFD